MKIRYVLKSWDIWGATLGMVAAILLLPGRIDIAFAKDTYFVGLSVLAIIFAIFFASLAIIMSASHDDFVSFLEENNSYTALISTFRYILMLLFIALLFSIVMYVYTSYLVSQGDQHQTKWWFVCFTFLSLYALFAVVMSTRDTINYSKYRALFLEIRKGKGRQD